jgi:hypothetical protein
LQALKGTVSTSHANAGWLQAGNYPALLAQGYTEYFSINPHKNELTKI